MAKRRSPPPDRPPPTRELNITFVGPRNLTPEEYDSLREARARKSRGRPRTHDVSGIRARYEHNRGIVEQWFAMMRACHNPRAKYGAALGKEFGKELAERMLAQKLKTPDPIAVALTAKQYGITESYAYKVIHSGPWRKPRGKRRRSLPNSSK